jgi:integrase
LYIEEKPKNQLEKASNAETLKIAEGIRQKREYTLNRPEIYLEDEKEKIKLQNLQEANFLDYFKKVMQSRKLQNPAGWESTFAHLVAFAGENLKIKDITESFVNGFRNYLLSAPKRGPQTPLANNTASMYFSAFRAVLRRLYKDGLIQVDLAARVNSIPLQETTREFLTIEELNRLAETHCQNDIVKRAALFSALTGLRYSDIRKLRWQDVVFVEGEGYRIKFVQQKTGGVVYQPISEQAYQLLKGNTNPEEVNPEGLVFEGLSYSAVHSKHFFRWIGAAGITKDITFHCFRHTFATLLLFHGTDIYTVSKLLGHRNVRATQVYAKIIDETKRRAVERIRINLNSNEH